MENKEKSYKEMDGSNSAHVMALLVSGRATTKDFGEKEGKKALSAKIDPILHAKLEEYRKKTKLSKTTIVEMLLGYGIKAVEDTLEDFDLDKKQVSK